MHPPQICLPIKTVECNTHQSDNANILLKLPDIRFKFYLLFQNFIMSALSFFCVNMFSHLKLKYKIFYWEFLFLNFNRKNG